MRGTRFASRVAIAVCAALLLTMATPLPNTSQLGPVTIHWSHLFGWLTRPPAWARPRHGNRLHASTVAAGNIPSPSILLHSSAIVHITERVLARRSALQRNEELTFTANRRAQ